MDHDEEKKQISEKEGIRIRRTTMPMRKMEKIDREMNNQKKYVKERWNSEKRWRDKEQIRGEKEEDGKYKSIDKMIFLRGKRKHNKKEEKRKKKRKVRMNSTYSIILL